MSPRGLAPELADPTDRDAPPDALEGVGDAAVSGGVIAGDIGDALIALLFKGGSFVEWADVLVAVIGELAKDADGESTELGDAGDLERITPFAWLSVDKSETSPFEKSAASGADALDSGPVSIADATAGTYLLPPDVEPPMLTSSREA